MGFIQKDALRTVIISYLGLVLGYVNKGLLFIWFLSTKEIGLLNLLLSVGLLFGNLAGLGSSYAIWKFFPFLRNPEKKNYGFLSLILIISLAGGTIFSLLAVIFRPEIVSNYEAKSSLFVDNYYWIIPLGFAYLLYVILDSFLKSMYFNIVSVFVYDLLLRGLIFLLLVVYGLHLISFDTLVTIHCLLYFVPVIILALYMARKGQFHLSLKSISIPKRFRKIILSFSLFSYINTIGSLVVTTIDAMMVASMIGLAATGVYTTVIFLTSALQIPYKSLIRISSPLVSDHWKDKDMVKMSELYKKFSSVNLVLSLSLFLFIWVCRNEIFHFLPKEFEEGIWVFLFLMIGRLTDMYMGINGVIFATSKKYKYDIFFTIALMGIVVVLNTLLIPEYGITGSAIATCIAYLVYNFGRAIFVYIVYKLHPFERNQLKVLLLFAGVLSFFEFVPIAIENDFLAIAVKWTLLAVGFLLPIYFFRLETEIVQYIDKALVLVKEKLNRSVK